MSNIELLYSFIEDIKKINEPLILKNIFNKLLDNNNNYIKDKDDHKIKGTKNTWIRKISGKKNAFRLFYISKNEKIYLWRIGTKKIEDNIIENYNFENSFPITNSTNVIENKTFNQTNYDYYLGKILYSKNDFSYSREIGSLFLASLNEISLVSPFLSEEIFGLSNPFGRFLIKQIQEQNTLVRLLTLPPKTEKKYRFFQKLERNAIFCHFKKDLHAKLYIFNLNREKSRSEYKNKSDVTIIGSANLSNQGINFEKMNNSNVNDEIGFKLSQYDNNNILKTLDYLFNDCIPFDYITRNFKKYIKYEP